MVLQWVLNVPGEIPEHDRELVARKVNPDVPCMCQQGKGVYCFSWKKLWRGHSLVSSARCCRLPGSLQIRLPREAQPTSSCLVRVCSRGCGLADGRHIPPQA